MVVLLTKVLPLTGIISQSCILNSCNQAATRRTYGGEDLRARQQTDEDDE